MTGIERLRGLARRMDGLGVWPGGGRLRDIAAQIEREHAQTCEDHERQQRIIRGLQRERDEALRELRVLRDSTAEGQVLAVESVRASAMDALEWVEDHGGLEAVKAAIGAGDGAVPGGEGSVE